MWLGDRTVCPLGSDKLLLSLHWLTCMFIVAVRLSVNVNIVSVAGLHRELLNDTRCSSPCTFTANTWSSMKWEQTTDALRSSMCCNYSLLCHVTNCCSYLYSYVTSCLLCAYNFRQTSLQCFEAVDLALGRHVAFRRSHSSNRKGFLQGPQGKSTQYVEWVTV